MRYDLVIFDNDGVLVDSEPISRTVFWPATSRSWGTPRRTRSRSGTTWVPRCTGSMSSCWNGPGQELPDGFDDAFHARVFAAFERELRPVAGVAEVLAEPRPTGCRTAWRRPDRTGGSRRRCGPRSLARWFDPAHVFSADDVGRGKPAPDLFLHAARVMGVEPVRCAVVEDSPAGVAAGVAAGMDVYGFAAIARTAVVLPAPFGPSTPNTVARSIWKPTPAQRTRLP